MRFQKEEIAAFILIVCALAVTGILYLLAGAVSPYSWSSHDGDRVSVTGLVLSKDTTYKGGHITLTIKTDAGPLSVFVPASSDAFRVANRTRQGNEIEAIGTVKTYKGQKEVVAETIKAK